MIGLKHLYAFTMYVWYSKSDGSHNDRDKSKIRCISDYTNVQADMNLVMRKPALCICENKDADQLRGNREADQGLCFRYTDSTIPLLPKSEI